MPELILVVEDEPSPPFSMRELLARIKAQLQRMRMIRAEVENQNRTSHKPLRFGNLTIDAILREALIDGNPLSLQPKEYELMLFLASHREQALSRNLILERVWGWEFTGGSRTVDVHIR